MKPSTTPAAALNRFLAPALLATAAIATGDASLEEKLRSTEAALDALEVHRVKLRDFMLETGSRSMAGDLLATEAELESLKAERDALVAKLEGASGPLFEGRVAEVAEALRAEPLDRKRVNAQLRSVLSRVALDTVTLTGTLVWKHGGQSEFVFGFPAEEPKASRAKLTKAASARKRRTA